MQRATGGQQGWRERVANLGRASVPYWFALSGLALGVAAIIKDEPVAGAGGAVAGVTAGFVAQRRARFHRDHVDALRERLRIQRQESEQLTAQLRHTVSSLQTELWQHRMVALATPAFGLQMSAIKGSLPHAPPPAPPRPTPTTGPIPVVTGPAPAATEPPRVPAATEPAPTATEPAAGGPAASAPEPAEKPAASTKKTKVLARFARAS